MIRMLTPSLVINSHDVPGPTYHMWRTVKARRGAYVHELIDYIDDGHRVALETFGYRLLNIVINCHGQPGSLYVGGDGTTSVSQSEVSALAPLRGKGSGTIWLVSCNVAKGNFGKDFCQALAVTTGYQVVAADDFQEVGLWGGYNVLFVDNCIDEFEGNVFGFYASGTHRQIDPHEDVFTIYD